MNWPSIIRTVKARIHDPDAQDREIGALYREGLLTTDLRHVEALERIYARATQALADGSDTVALLEICAIVEEVLSRP